VFSADEDSNSTRPTQEDEFDLDLEDIMVMEAIWLSIQENGKHQEPPNSNAAQSEEYVVEDRSSLAIAGSSSAFPSGGLACAIAALAERQQMSGETSNNYGGDVSMYNMPGYSRYSNRDEQESENYFPAQSAVVVSPDSPLAMTGDAREWVDHRSEVAEVGTSYGGSDEFDDAMNPAVLPQQDENQCSLQPVTGQIIPESFEEQMMLAMAFSLAEARARTSTPGVAWH
ncbi:UNVERIFIED_CONTAM: E3 ubiquitin-protein ligase GW2, partial [Sesamum latifolium]